MLFLQGKCEPIDDRSQDFKQLRNTVEPFRFIDELEKDIVDGSSNKRSQVQELAIDAMEGGLKEVSFTRIF